MNLPFILDVAIGLIFIYLILSLLASEIQELLTTLLQWRAIHLKQSIEVLLTGGGATQEVEEVKSIVHDLYDNPLIKNINQEAKSGIAIWLRQFTWGIGEAYRQLRGKKKGNFNDNHSGPSYIPAETFSTTLLDKLSIAKLSNNFTCTNLKKFKDDEIKAPIEGFINAELQISENTLVTLKKEVAIFGENLDKIFDNFQLEKASLITSINRIKFELEAFINDLRSSKIHFQEDEESYKERLIKNLDFLKANIFSDCDNTEELVSRLQPSLDKVIRQISISSQIWKEYQNVKDDPNSEIYKQYHALDQEMQAVIHKLPPQLSESLCALAARAQIKAVKVEEEVNQFKKEIETWFDRSMDRASGVYKRNAKGVAFLIGFLLAMSANADTFHIIDRLSKDTTLRNAIAGSATQIRQNSDGLEGVTNQVNQVLNDIAFPIGWSQQNLPHEKQTTSQILAYIKKFFGWLVSGLAISMGASFWFEMLGKLINVRNTGAKPKSAAHNRGESQQ